jgi:antirestriction protein ArdC
MVRESGRQHAMQRGEQSTLLRMQRRSVVDGSGGRLSHAAPAQPFFCSEFSIESDLRHAGHLQNWIGLLKADSRAFFTARSKAQAAADYLRSLALSDHQGDAAA